MMGIDKQTLRQQLRARRKDLSDDAVRAASAAVCRHAVSFPAYRSAASVTAYIASENEIETTDIIDDATQTGRPLYLPRMLEEPALVRWQPDQPLRRSRLGVLEPESAVSEDPETPAIAFLPVVGWDRAGARLGRGGGFYDRLLKRLEPLPLCVGLAYELQEITELPREPWDVPVQFIITEKGIVRCGDADVARFFERGGR